MLTSVHVSGMQLPIIPEYIFADAYKETSTWALFWSGITYNGPSLATGDSECVCLYLFIPQKELFSMNIICNSH